MRRGRDRDVEVREERHHPPADVAEPIERLRHLRRATAKEIAARGVEQWNLVLLLEGDAAPRALEEQSERRRRDAGCGLPWRDARPLSGFPLDLVLEAI